MTHACCPECRLRVATASPADAPSCPECRQPMVRISAVEGLGLRLVTPEHTSLSAAVAAAMTLPLPPEARP
jgi:Zn finger protein HypA/HybF involved in hydrogenase expression